MSNENHSAESRESGEIESGRRVEETPAITLVPATPVVSNSNQGADNEPIDVGFREQSRLGSNGRPRFPDFESESETFPWQMLPETIRGAVIEICKNDKVAVPIAVQAVLSAVSLACQDLIWVDRGIEKNEKTVCSLYMLAVADSGSRKSRADTVVTSSIETYDRTKRSHFVEQKEAGDYEQKERLRKRRELEKASGTLRRKSHTLAISDKPKAAELAQIAREKLEDVEREIAELHKQDLAYHEPRLQRVLYSKIPIRQLEQNLAENWPSAGLFSDEAAGILNARGESDMSSLDKLWEGKAIDVVGRTARESFFVEDPRLTISLMVQPIVFDRFLESKGELAKGIGFMSRVLLCRPDTPYGKRQINSAEPKRTEWIELFNKRVLAILAHAHAHRDMVQRNENRKTLHFAPAAQQAWEKDFNEMEAAIAEGGVLVHEREFVNRYSEHVARIAALFHFFENDMLAGSGKHVESHSGDLVISESTVTSTMRIAEWYLDEFKKVFNPEVVMKEMATYVMKKFRRMLEDRNGGPLEAPTGGHLNCRVPFHDLRSNCNRYGLRNTEKLRTVLAWLVARGNVLVRAKEVRRKEMAGNPASLEPEMVEIQFSVVGPQSYRFHFEISG